MKKALLVVVAGVTVPWLALLGLVVVFTSSALADQQTGCSSSSAVDLQGRRGPDLAVAAAAGAGFTGPDLVIAVAIAGAESSYNPRVRNSIGASGLWQILERAHPDLFARYDWRDPAQNAQMAQAVWQAAKRSWTPWTTFTSGAYRGHLLEAQAAVSAFGGAANESSSSSVTMVRVTPTIAAGSDAGSPPVCPPAAGGLPPSPRPFTGPDGYVDDPTSSGRITRRMLHVYEEVERAFGGWPWGVGCWDPHAWNPTSDHPRGKACDFAVGRIGKYPDDAQRARGWQFAHWLQANADVSTSTT